MRYVILALVISLLIVLVMNIHVWEDGSWAFGHYPYPIGGCIHLPWFTCQ